MKETEAIAYDTFSYTDERTIEPTALRLLQTAITTMTSSSEGDKPVTETRGAKRVTLSGRMSAEDFKKGNRALRWKGNNST